jgi:signal peptidase I
LEVRALLIPETSPENAPSDITPQDSAPQEKPAWQRNLTAIGIAVAVALLLRLFLLQASWVPTGSMIPTLRPGDFILINRLVYLVREPERGEVIVFEHDDLPYVKRIIALPGERFRIRDGWVYIDGQLLDETRWLPDDVLGKTRGLGFSDTEHTVPPESYLVMGDNREHSRDSRRWGFVHRDDIMGKAFLIYLSVDVGPMIEDGNGWFAAPAYLRLDRMFDVIR